MAYIDKDKLLQDIAETVIFSGRPDKPSAELRGVRKVVDRIRNAPTVDAVEVGRCKDCQQSEGEWVLLDECSNEGVYCSVCHKKVYRKEYANQKLKSNFCPNCGAKMDGGRDA